MTIQNIEDVMDRIMSLNRNLNEDSLRTLLSASGWDKEDIIEGLRIFKLRNLTAHPFYEPGIAAPTYSPEVKPDENYSFNIKKEKGEEDPETEISIIPLPLASTKGADSKVEIKNPKMEGPVAPVAPIAPEPLKEEKPKKTFPAKIFSLILISILTVLAIAYFFPASFGNFINKMIVRNNNKTQVITPSQNINTSPSNLNSTSSSSTLDSVTSSTSLASLLQEISNLRNELNTYKAATQSTKTIVKYISQKGASGKAGRGITSISATSTGFVINYTDNTSTIIPYSTTTIINILNSNSVCFRDISSSTQIGNDICLDRNAVSKLIASSTSSQ